MSFVVVASFCLADTGATNGRICSLQDPGDYASTSNIISMELV